jgi:hypothetical protein
MQLGEKILCFNYFGTIKGGAMAINTQLDNLFHKIDLNNRLKPITTCLNNKFQCSTMDLNNRLKPQTMQVWSLRCSHEL